MPDPTLPGELTPERLMEGFPGLKQRPRVLLLIPSVVKRNVEEATRQGEHPLMDYFALQAALGADILDYSALETAEYRIVRILRRAGHDVALAALGVARRANYDVIFSNGENVGIPLAAMLGPVRQPPLHVMIGHRISPTKKRPFLKAFRPRIDAMFVYATTQYRIAVEQLGFDPNRTHLIPFHADHRFYCPQASQPDADYVCSAGLEWRDYPTLIEAMQGLNVEARLAAASPWSKHRNETRERLLPPNVSARRYEYGELRELYAGARFVVVPLYENNFQAGITTILEGMAMGKAVITTRTTGQTDTIRDGENGLYVPPGDAPTLRAAIVRLLENPEEAARLGAAARRDMECSATLDHWVHRIATKIYSLAEKRLTA